MVRSIYFGGRGSSNSENNGIAKPQSVLTKSLNLYLRNLRLNSLRVFRQLFRQPSLLTVTELQPYSQSQNIQLSSSSLSINSNEPPHHLISMWSGSSARVDRPAGCPDKVTTEFGESYLMSITPLYAECHRPNQAQKNKIIYFELQDFPDRSTRGNIRFGFSTLEAKGPPGSGPGSLGIDISDGNLYYNNIQVGKSHQGGCASCSHIGIGVVLAYVAHQSDSNSDSAIEVRVFHTRRGVLVDDVYVDTLDGIRQDGFDGCHDIFATVETFDRVVFEVLFEETEWAFNPRENGF
jgi:hypothetical protein